MKIRFLFFLVGLMLFGSFAWSQNVAIPVGQVPPASVKRGQTIYVTELIGGKQTWRAITVGSLNDFVGLDSAKAQVYPFRVVNVMSQNNAAGLRNRIVRTLDELVYFVDFRGNSVLLASTATTGATPTDAVTIGGAQTITGQKRFSDTIMADNGMRSGGVIDTKGLNTEGGVSKPSATFNGVQKTKRRLITANTTLDGLDFCLEVFCSTGDITVLLPAIAVSDGWFYDIKRTDSTAFVVKFQRPDGTVIRILNKRAVTLRNNGTQWAFD
jgi:hypothetical protein